MIYYISDMLFGNETVARKRHYSNASDMNNDIISNWNRTVYPTDTVYIIGGVGDFSFLKGLNGDKILLMSDKEKDDMLKYVSDITPIRDEEYDSDMYSWYMKSEYGISNVIYTGRLLRKDYSGKLLRLTTVRDSMRESVISIIGGMGNEYQRLFKNGINSNVFVNGMYPVSEVEVGELLKHIDELI